MEEVTLVPPAETATWSKSQIATYKDCLRKAFYSYRHKAEGEHKRLKSLANRYLWSGATLHSTIGDLLKLLRQGSPLPVATELIQATREKMRQAFKDSMTNPQSLSRLFEHEYARPISNDMWSGHWSTIERSLQWFYNSKWLTRLQELGPENWKAVDDVLAFDVEGVKSYVKIDCGLEIDGTFHVIDWKSSTPKPADDFGLQVAALYAVEVWGADPTQINARAVSLLDGQTRPVPVDEEILMDTALRMTEEAAFIINASENFSDDPTGVPATTDKRICLGCNYQRLCYPDGL